ncbi:MAG: aldolase [Armatimonadetes bacterium]|nr:aldolase [Armatimonadota bacterium]
MSIGKKVRMNRLFSHPSGRLCAVAVDHFIGYAEGLPAGLRRIEETLEKIVAGRPDSVTMHRGIAESAWEPFAGRVPFILQSSIARPDDSVCEQIADPVDAIRLGADGFAMAAFLRGTTEGAHLKALAECVKAAAVYEMPVIVHAYPRDFSDGPKISYTPEDIAWAVRCSLECGADIIKAPYCGDMEAFRQIVSACPAPIVAAGGPQTETLVESLSLLQQVVRSGAKGAVVGRNVWSLKNITGAVLALKAAIYEDKTPEEAAALAEE